MVRCSVPRRNGHRIMGIVPVADTDSGVCALSINHFRTRAGSRKAQGGASMRGKVRYIQDGSPRSSAACAVVLTLGLMLAGCTGETFQRGYMLPEGALQQIPLGASQEQVLIVLGTPSTVATVSGESFYYISQRAE